MIKSQSTVASDITKKLKGDFSKVQHDSVIKRNKRFISNELFDHMKNLTVPERQQINKSPFADVEKNFRSEWQHVVIETVKQLGSRIAAPSQIFNRNGAVSFPIINNRRRWHGN